MECCRCTVTSGAWDIGSAAVRGGEAIGCVDTVETRLRPTDRVIAKFQCAGFRISGRNRRTECPGIIAPAQQTGKARSKVFRQIIVRTHNRQRAVKTSTASQRIAGIQVDNCAQRTFVKRCFGCFTNHKAAEEFRCKYVEIESTVAVCSRAVCRGRDRLHAVDAYACELRRETTNRDRPAFAAITADRNAGNTLKRFRKVLVREFCNVFGHNRVHCGDGIALQVQRSFQRSTEAGDNNCITFICRCSFSGSIFGCGVLRMGCAYCQNAQ